MRTEMARILRKTKLPKTNIKPRELVALKKLNKYKSILVLQADKKNTMMLLSTVNYNKQMEVLPEHVSYRELKKDLIQRIAKTTNSLVKT